MIAPGEAGSLSRFIVEYALDRGIGSSSLRALRYVVNSYERFLKRPPTLADLDRMSINGWLAWQLSRELDPETVRNRRTAMLGIWKHACECEYLDAAPVRIRKIKVPAKVTTCWDLETELRKLLQLTQELQGMMKKDERVARSDFWQSWIYVDLGTGYRLGDLMRLGFSNIAQDGTTTIVQHKTGEVAVGRIEPAGMALIDRLRLPGRELVFGDLMNPTNAQRYFRKLVRQAGLKGSTKWIRRTGATWSEVQNPGSAQHYLGHKTPGLAWRSYLDFRFLRDRKPDPPRLG